MSAHVCHAPGCTRQIPPHLFACHTHWRLVPLWLQTWLLREYRPGQEHDKRPSARYCAVQARCRLALARIEKRDEATIRLDLLRWCTVADLTEAETDRLWEGL